MAKIVSVHSFRGGTGKSNLTANLATMVAMLASISVAAMSLPRSVRAEPNG